MIRSLPVGHIEQATRTILQADLDRFAVVSGDDNPIHVDPAFSARTKFGRTVAHGMFLYGVVNSVWAGRLPGARQVDQDLVFPHPTHAGEEVTARIEVLRVQPEAGLVELAVAVLRADGAAGLEGRTRLRLPGAGVVIVPAGEQQEAPAGPTAERLKGLRIGQRAETRRTFSPDDLVEYADLTGDANPLFSDATYARALGFAGPLLPGGLLGGMFSCLLGTRLPGKGTNYLKQRLEFPAPAYAGQQLIATVEITRLRPDKQLVNLATRCVSPGGAVVCCGEALVLVSDVAE